MADSLYLSLWFPSFDEAEILPRTVSVLRQIPFSAARSGVTYSAIQPVSWGEPTILERRYRPGVAPEEAVAEVAEFLGRYCDNQDSKSRARMVRNGYLPERTIQTGVGDVVDAGVLPAPK